VRDVSGKRETLRTAKAEAWLHMAPETVVKVRNRDVPKGDVLASARVAGIQAAKRTQEWLPFCHVIPIDYADIEWTLEETGIVFRATVRTVWRTGVEMEALTAATAAALTAFDMLKPLDGQLSIEWIRLLEKRGGKSEWLPHLTGSKAALIWPDSHAVSDAVLFSAVQQARASFEAFGIREFDSEAQNLGPGAGAIFAIADVFVARGFNLVLFLLDPSCNEVALRELADATSDVWVPCRGLEHAILAQATRRNARAMLTDVAVRKRKTTLLAAIPLSDGWVSDALTVLVPVLAPEKGQPIEEPPK
jgi:cyclic pyranopterin monophosphate synthase